MKTYQHIFFDLDHTLWDFEQNSKSSMREIYTHFELDVHVTKDFNSFFETYSHHNKVLWDRFQKGHIRSDELKWKRMWRTLLDYKKPDEALAVKMNEKYLEILPTQKAVFPNTVEILTHLKEKNYSLHLITNGFEKVQKRKIENCGIAPFFTEMITSESSNSMKPEREIFETAFRKTGAEPSHSIMIGDNLEADIQGGINAGMDTVFVNHIGTEATKIPTYTIHDLIELKNIL
jgi:putative hydrolase of the HAD superfamily